MKDRVDGLEAMALSLARLGVLGRSPAAPGTVATLAAGIPSAWVVAQLPYGWACLILVLLFPAACWACDRAQQILVKADPGEVVVDELMGFLVTMIGLPATGLSLLLGALFFRLFDIWKPWPVNVLDGELHGGLGIMADDVAAGLYAHAAVAFLLPLLERL
ncbi:phosphatidylglycerophosphatase A family protein [Desulfacinum hydrothermale]|nr:phosphatidylglycerophosphatase A [Desulfacinum hydrothermale]